MPELPEVETSRLYVEEFCLGTTIARVNATEQGGGPVSVGLHVFRKKEQISKNMFLTHPSLLFRGLPQRVGRGSGRRPWIRSTSRPTSVICGHDVSLTLLLSIPRLPRFFVVARYHSLARLCRLQQSAGVGDDRFCKPHGRLSHAAVSLEPLTFSILLFSFWIIALVLSSQLQFFVSHKGTEGSHISYL